MAGVSMYASNREIRASRTVHTCTMATSNADAAVPRVSARPPHHGHVVTRVDEALDGHGGIDRAQQPREELPHAVVPR